MKNYIRLIPLDDVYTYWKPFREIVTFGVFCENMEGMGWKIV